eukprot:TRINITY_DN25932_c1_g1_i1.p1 TRINITY_DN25932_c1_g1~~TRINITY_DN25932_c1_g1_i1.p1  ORF type:complete len:115 (+),score=5.64 TRINITY_DN25932_c1_g1_i1:47-391(+)
MAPEMKSYSAAYPGSRTCQMQASGDMQTQHGSFTAPSLFRSSSSPRILLSSRDGVTGFGIGIASQTTDSANARLSRRRPAETICSNITHKAADGGESSRRIHRIEQRRSMEVCS